MLLQLSIGKEVDRAAARLSKALTQPQPKQPHVHQQLRLRLNLADKTERVIFWPLRKSRNQEGVKIGEHRQNR